jgi:hypothetical protein
MTRDKKAFNTKINPIHGEIRQINSLVFEVLVDMWLKGETVGAIPLSEIILVILAIPIIWSLVWYKEEMVGGGNLEKRMNPQGEDQQEE